MYSLHGYGDMIRDKIRMEAYARAMRHLVKPGSVVLEIGTGPGIFAILASQLGARRVFAIEPNEVIQVARENAVANHCADRIEFIEGLSTDVALPAKADLIFSDLRGVLPLFGKHIPAIVDARKRFLAPNGVLCPRKDTLWAAIVEIPNLYAEIVEAWERNALGQDLAAGRRRILDTYMKTRATPEHLLTEPQLVATFDYSTIEDPDLHCELQWTAKRAGTGHGILLWFDADLAEGVAFSNSPFEPLTVYASMFYPWAQPVALSKGESIRVELEAKLAGNDYVWRWNTHVNGGENTGKAGVRFDQSSLSAFIVSSEMLRKTASNHVAKLSEEGGLARRVLELMDGHATLEEIARTLAAEYPGRFGGWYDAMKFAGAISQKYSV
jgi:protein arginine N-methyltransferase 1